MSSPSIARLWATMPRPPGTQAPRPTARAEAVRAKRHSRIMGPSKANIRLFAPGRINNISGSRHEAQGLGESKGYGKEDYQNDPATRQGRAVAQARDRSGPREHPDFVEQCVRRCR